MPLQSGLRKNTRLLLNFTLIKVMCAKYSKEFKHNPGFSRKKNVNLP